MRDYVGTFWKFQYDSKDEEYLVVSKTDDGWVLLEMQTGVIHPPAVGTEWFHLLWLHRYYHGRYFDNHTLVPVSKLEEWRETIETL